MPEGGKPYTVYRGGKVRGSVPAAGDAPGDGKPARERPRRPRRLRIGLALGVLLLVAVVFVVAWGVAGYLSFRGGVGSAGKRLDKATRAELSGHGGALWSHGTTILLMGTDHSDSAAAGRSGDRHADSMMLVRTDPKHHRIAYLSIPRDLYVAIPGHGRSKINAAYQIGGPALEMRTVKQFTGLDVDHVAIVDFASFKDIIDRIGGVTVNNDKAIVSNRFDCPFTAERCASWKGWRFARGKIHLSGLQALAYSRIRENRLDASDTDFTRGERQQQVVNAIGAQLATVSTFFDLPFIGSDLLKPLSTDLSAWQILQLGWVRFRSSSGNALHCRLGGDPARVGLSSVILPSELNRATVLMFLGKSAPQPPPRGGTYQPGCTVGNVKTATTASKR